jgi:hypothetical protein
VAWAETLLPFTGSVRTQPSTQWPMTRAKGPLRNNCFKSACVTAAWYFVRLAQRIAFHDMLSLPFLVPLARRGASLKHLFLNEP